MRFIVEKLLQKEQEIGFQPTIGAEVWEEKDIKDDQLAARISVIEYATKIEKGKYRVRDKESGKIVFKIST